MVIGIAVFFSRPEKPKIFDPGLVIGDARNATGSGELIKSGLAAAASDGAQPNSKQVVVTEFSDFQCTACKAVLPEIDKVVETDGGRVKLVYRHYPIEEIHKNAMESAVAAEAAAEWGKFWEYGKLLFEKQDDWSGSDQIENLLVGYATELGMPGEEFKQKMKNPQILERIKKDQADARMLGINGTPTLFVDGEMVTIDKLGAKVGEKLANNL